MEKYNGYTNYSTWCLCLWLDNDRNQYNYWKQRANQIDDYDLGQEIKAYFEDVQNPLADHADLYSDLLNYALSEINWREVVEKLKED